MICIPIKVKTSTLLMKEIKEAQKKADIIEIWFDEVKITESALSQIFKIKKRPFIYKITNAKNIKILTRFKPEFLDIDYKTSKKNLEFIQKNFPKSKKIISYHNFKKTPSKNQIKKVFTKIKNMAADIIKIAVTAKKFSDNLIVLEFLAKTSQKNKIIALCMGQKGILTRVAGHLFGNYLMYAPLKEDKKTAKGQVEISKLKQLQCLLK